MRKKGTAVVTTLIVGAFWAFMAEEKIQKSKAIAVSLKADGLISKYLIMTV
jgi:hypothetical protein